MHVLVFLAHVAWNRDTKSPDYLEDVYRKQLKKFPAAKSVIKKQMISHSWDTILDRMIKYKKEHFPGDKRIITVCGYTPRETFRVEWV